MVMDSIVANIENLIQTLYSEPKCNEKTFEETNKLLISLQQSKEAWIFAWILLNKEKSLNVQYFGASCLYLKLTKHHYELDSNSYCQIQWKIIENLINYMECSDFNLITTKLISCLAVSVIRNIDTTWNNSLQDIVNYFQPEKLPHIPPTRVIKILLEILCAIPDEFNNPYNDKNKKISVRAELIRHAESIILLIHKVLTEENISDELTKICLKCLSNWNVGLDYYSDNIQIELILNFVRNENTCHDAVECIIAIYTNPFTHKQPKLVLKLIEKMPICLRDVIDNHKSNHDYLRNVYLLFCSIGEIHTRILLDSLIDLSINSEIVIEYFNIILRCSSTPNFFAFDENISDMPFSFWINFLDDLIASDEEKIQTYLNIFKDILNSLINIYLFKIQYPPDEIYEQVWDNDDRDKFRCYRQDVADTYSYCYTILKESVLEVFLEHFHIAFKQMISATSNSENDNNNNNNNNLVNSSIRYLEAVLFAFSTLTENISNEENVFMPQILATFNLLPMQCLNCSFLLSTINSFLSSLSDWLNSNINYISFTLNIIKNSLKSSSKMVTISATLALKLITKDCQKNLSQFAFEIIAICEEGFKYSNLDYRNKARLMHSLATILSIMPLEVIMQTIDRILVPLLAEMEIILSENTNNLDTNVHIGGVLLILSNLFAQLDTKPKLNEFEIENDDDSNENKNTHLPQPLYKIFEKVLPMFEIIVLNYSMYDDIIENLCECIKKTVVNLMDDVKAFVGNILNLLINLYQNSKSIAVLNISRQLFILFYKDAQILPALQEYFYSICNVTIELFKRDFRGNTFLVQNFYEEGAQALRKATIVFLHPSSSLNHHLSTLFEWAVAGILLPEKGTVHQCSVFISEFLNQGRHDERFHKVIDEHFERLVIKVFIVIGGTQGSPSFAVDYMPDIIMTLNQKYSDSFSRTLKAFIETDGFPTDIVNRDQKSRFVQLVTSTLRNNKRKLKEVVKEFSSQCRGLFGVDKR